MVNKTGGDKFIFGDGRGANTLAVRNAEMMREEELKRSPEITVDPTLNTAEKSEKRLHFSEIYITVFMFLNIAVTLLSATVLTLIFTGYEGQTNKVAQLFIILAVNALCWTICIINYVQKCKRRDRPSYSSNIGKAWIAFYSILIFSALAITVVPLFFMSSLTFYVHFFGVVFIWVCLVKTMRMCLKK